MSIGKFLNSLRSHVQQPGASSETETVRKIVSKLDQMQPEQARYIAAFAYILSRVARSDMNISPEETAEMERRVMTVGGLSEDQAILVVQIAKTQTTLFGGTENFLVTREFHEMATHDQKLALLRCLFAVAAADKDISTVEDREIRLINDELQLRHDDFIAARLEYKRFLSVLKSE
jgi:uncharacterized tellurite resistance protein B-like protein